MTPLSRLLTKKQQLIERLHEDPDPEERGQIERLLEQINDQLRSVDRIGSVGGVPLVALPLTQTAIDMPPTKTKGCFHENEF